MSARTPAVLALVLFPHLLAAEGLTRAAIVGTVAEQDGSPIAGASVRVINASTGARWEVVTRSSGRFLLEDVAIGGPYRIEVLALGFGPETKRGIMLALGQRLVADSRLRATAIQLERVNAEAERLERIR